MDIRPFSAKVAYIKWLDAHLNSQENCSAAHKIHDAVHQTDERGGLGIGDIILVALFDIFIISGKHYCNFFFKAFPCVFSEFVTF